MVVQLVAKSARVFDHLVTKPNFRISNWTKVRCLCVESVLLMPGSGWGLDSSASQMDSAQSDSWAKTTKRLWNRPSMIIDTWTVTNWKPPKQFHTVAVCVVFHGAHLLGLLWKWHRPSDHRTEGSWQSDFSKGCLCFLCNFFKVLFPLSFPSPLFFHSVLFFFCLFAKGHAVA